MFRDFPTFSRICIFFLLTLSLLLFSLLIFLFSLPLPCSAFHLFILSEVWLLNFLRLYIMYVYIYISISIYIDIYIYQYLYIDIYIYNIYIYIYIFVHPDVNFFFFMPTWAVKTQQPPQGSPEIGLGWRDRENAKPKKMMKPRNKKTIGKWWLNQENGDFQISSWSMMGQLARTIDLQHATMVDIERKPESRL